MLLSNTVLLKTVWVLESVYSASREDVLNTLDKIMSLATPETPMAPQILDWLRDGVDVADAMHLATAATARCGTLYSFDLGLVKKAKGKDNLYCDETSLIGIG